MHAFILWYWNVFTLQTPAVQFDFVKPGEHLGALGCVVADAKKSASS